ncbi:MAG: transposase, partial [Endozoicomonadaceae bacterium]|nr:transposase [Endozoicomonadaceae bacterium]
MIRDFLTDILWEKIQIIMKKNQCHRWKNDRHVISAILWKLHTGSPW